MNTSVVIVCLNGRDRIAMPLDALRSCDPAPGEIIVVDNGSTDGTGDFVRRNYPEAIVLRASRNLGFAGGNNLGIGRATGDIVVLLNDDTEPRANWLAPLLAEFRANPKTGVAGCLLLYPDNVTVQHCGGRIEPNGLTSHIAWGRKLRPGRDPGEARDVPYATGAALAIRREVIDDIGPLDARYWPIYFEEVDYCVRARRAGWNVRVVPRSIVVHHESQTTVAWSPGFLAKYHRNRWRFLLRTKGLRRAARAEWRWWRQHRPWNQLAPCAKAYAWAALSLLRRDAR